MIIYEPKCSPVDDGGKPKSALALPSDDNLQRSRSLNVLDGYAAVHNMCVMPASVGKVCHARQRGQG